MGKEKYVRRTATYEGKRYEAYGITEADAYLKLAAKIEAAKRGEDKINHAMTVNAWYAQWKATYKEPKGLTAKSLGMYDEKYNGYIRDRIGHLKLKDVKEIHLQQILNDQAGMSHSHVHKLRMVMQEMFKRARQSRLIQYDPAETLELPTSTKGSRRAITPAEREAILAVAENHRAGLWILTLLYTGMRPGETAALYWSDVDFDNDEIHVHAARESGTHDTIKAPKTAAGVRDIPIHSALRPKLWAARQAPFSPVFPTQAGNRQNENSLLRMWRSFKRDLDIYMGAEVYRNKIVKSVLDPGLTPYCLRHTFCTDLEIAGVPLNVAKVLMGHSDIKTTANIYTHKDKSTIERGIRMLDGSDVGHVGRVGRTVGQPVGQRKSTG